MINISFRTWFEEIEPVEERIKDALIKAIIHDYPDIKSDSEAWNFDLGKWDKDEVETLAQKGNFRSISDDKIKKIAEIVTSKGYKVNQLADLLIQGEEGQELRDEDHPRTYAPKTPAPHQNAPTMAPQAPMAAPPGSNIAPPMGSAGPPVMPPQMG